MTSLDLNRIYAIDGIITLVDAINAENTYNNYKEAIKQTALADKIILSKTDLSESSNTNSIKNRIKKINPKANIIESNKKNLPLT